MNDYVLHPSAGWHYIGTPMHTGATPSQSVLKLCEERSRVLWYIVKPRPTLLDALFCETFSQNAARWSFANVFRYTYGILCTQAVSKYNEKE